MKEVKGKDVVKEGAVIKFEGFVFEPTLLTVRTIKRKFIEQVRDIGSKFGEESTKRALSAGFKIVGFCYEGYCVLLRDERTGNFMKIHPLTLAEVMSKELGRSIQELVKEYTEEIPQLFAE